MATVRFYDNEYVEKKLKNVIYGTLCQEIAEFVQEAHINLRANVREFHENGSSSDDFCLYTGVVGVAMTAARIYRTFTESNDIAAYPIMDTKLNPREGPRNIGLCSNNMAALMYNCLINDKAFDISNSLYNNNESVSEILFGRAGLAMMISYFVRRGMKVRRNELISEVVESIKLTDFPWMWHSKVYYGAAHGTAGILMTIQRLGHVSRPDLVEYLLRQATLPSGS